MKTFKQFTQQLNEFVMSDNKGGGGDEEASHDRAVSIVRKHFKKTYGIGPDVTSSGEGENKTTIISHPKVKNREYSVMDDGEGTTVLHAKINKNGEHSHKNVSVNWNMNSLGKH